MEAAYSLSVLLTKVCARVMFIFGAEQCIFSKRKIFLGMKGLSYQLGVNSIPIRSVYKLACCGEMKGTGWDVEPPHEEQNKRSVLLNLQADWGWRDAQ